MLAVMGYMGFERFKPTFQKSKETGADVEKMEKQYQQSNLMNGISQQGKSIS